MSPHCVSIGQIVRRSLCLTSKCVDTCAGHKLYAYETTVSMPAMTPEQRPGPSHHHTQQSTYVPSMMLAYCNQVRYMTDDRMFHEGSLEHTQRCVRCGCCRKMWPGVERTSLCLEPLSFACESAKLISLHQVPTSLRPIFARCCHAEIQSCRGCPSYPWGECSVCKRA